MNLILISFSYHGVHPPPLTPLLETTNIYALFVIPASATVKEGFKDFASKMNFNSFL